jgi:hypothetical protein
MPVKWSQKQEGVPGMSVQSSDCSFAQLFAFADKEDQLSPVMPLSPIYECPHTIPLC